MSISNELTLHIALSTLPQNNYDKFVLDIEKNFYGNFKKHSKWLYSKCFTNNDQAGISEVLYNPLKYFIFGNYDIAFVSVIDRFKFAQKLFAPEEKGTLNPATFQIMTGITHYPGPGELKKMVADLHTEKSSKKFIGIINLKLNNGLLIGMGQFFLNRVIEKIKNLINNCEKKDDVKYVIQQSFSWFELSLVIFHDDPNALPDILNLLRTLQVDELDIDDKLIRESQYFAELGRLDKETELSSEKEKIKRLKACHVFADSYSYIGVHWRMFDDASADSLEELKKYDLRTEVEWIVKPGHFDLLRRMLEKDQTLSGLFDFEKSRILLGKSDYLLNAEPPTLDTNIKLIKNLYQHPEGLFSHIKKIKTKTNFSQRTVAHSKNNYDQKNINVATPVSLRGMIDDLIVPNDIITEINNKLKNLKVSRLLRVKTGKIFVNYNNGIQDPVLYTFFIDFAGFIGDIVKIVRDEHQSLDIFKDGNKPESDDSDSLRNFETALISKISNFEESFSVRMLNSYQFEDINDFDLDFNASIQQLLTTYNTFAEEVANIYYVEKYSQGRVVQLNYNNTVSNYDFINFSVYHLLCPEFIFFTISKEVLNYYSVKSDDFDRLKAEMLRIIKETHPLLADCVTARQVDFDYLFLDAVRLCVNCNMDFRLYSFWFWSYNCQNPSLYNKYGMIEEKHFVMEMIRVILLSKLYNIDPDELECPLDEFRTLWERYFFKLNEQITKCIDRSDFKILLQKFKSNINSIVANAFNTVKTKQGTATQDSTVDEQVNKKYWNFVHLLGECDEAAQQKRLKEFKQYYLSVETFFDEHTGQLEAGSPILYDKKKYSSCSMFVVGLIYSYLKFLYIKNNKKVHLLKRNWADGSPLKCFIDTEDSNDDFLYYVDQTGGTFFSDCEKMNRYFIIRNGVLQSLWHFGCVMKKNIISKPIKSWKDEFSTGS